MRAIYDEEAKRRRTEGGSRGGEEAGRGRPKGDDKEVADRPRPYSGHKTREAVGAVLGVGGRTVERAGKVLRDGSPELVAAVESGQISLCFAEKLIGLPPEMQKAAIANPAQRGKKSMLTAAKAPAASGELIGVGVLRANEAINSLSRIPKNDPFRKRGFQEDRQRTRLPARRLGVGRTHPRPPAAGAANLRRELPNCKIKQ